MTLRTAFIGAAATALLSATAAHATLLYQDNFDGNFAAAAGVVSIFGPYTADTALAGPWNASGWAGNIVINTTSGNPATFTTLSLSNLPSHTAISASFILGLLDSWDGYNGSFGPDNLEVWIDGVQQGNLTSNCAAGSAIDTDGGTVIAPCGSQANASSSFYSDLLVDMTGVGYLTFAHSANSLNIGIRASGAGWQGGADESWGIDNIHIEYTPATTGPGIPEPSSWALMIAGFGLAGATLRRRRERTA